MKYIKFEELMRYDQRQTKYLYLNYFSIINIEYFVNEAFKNSR